ncbi:MAG TPA: acylphosphatase, partial [Verrucomicrobiales bacterium]|nr:acylphosphatase [Verrucomicrobiales bacterium]
IRNLPDGRVELIVEGKQEELDAFLKAIRDSGLRRNIRDEEIVFGNAQDNFKGFEIVK